MEISEQRLIIIENYLEGYNSFDIEKMLENLHSDIVFINISNDKENLRTNGIAEFKSQAEQAKNIFKHRKQTINSKISNADKFEIGIDYEGILAQDLPNGLKSGSVLKLQGKSVFRFSGNKIIEIMDIS